MQPIAVIGAGSWGTALALYLARTGLDVRLWARRPALTEAIRQSGQSEYLPGFSLPVRVVVESDPRSAMQGVTTIVSAIPSHAVRDVFREFRSHIAPGVTILSATKGIEDGTCLLMSQVIQQVLGDELQPRIAALSGPSFALEVARGDPTAVVISSPDRKLARDFQDILSGGNIRTYTNTDLIGTQIGGAVKNVIAIAAGIVQGLGFGSNTAAALITRGLAELKRLCVAAGGQAETLSGLAGLGDLVLTSTGALSRNRSLGVELGKGRNLKEILAESRFVTEGVITTRSTFILAQRLNVELPITAQMHEVLYAAKSPLQAIRDLMDRELKSESGD